MSKVVPLNSHEKKHRYLINILTIMFTRHTKKKLKKKKRHSRTMLIYQNKFHLPISIKTDIIGNNPKASIFTPKAFNCDCLNRCQKQKDMRKKQRRSVTVRRLHSDDTQFMLLFGLLRPSLHFLIYLYPFVYPFIPLYISVHIF